MTTLSKAEISYIQSSLVSDPPLRADGRSPEDFRQIALETGVAPLANGSARVSIGRTGRDTDGGSSGTEVVAAVKLEVDGIGEEKEGGNVVCTVSWYAVTVSVYTTTNAPRLVPQQPIPPSRPLHSTISSRISAPC